jgi:hypothetical protein
MNSRIQCSLLKGLLMPFCLLICLSVFHSKSNAQEKPPRPIEVRINTAQHLSFGSFIVYGSGGTVIVYHDGARITSGNVIGVTSPSSLIVTPALFIVDAEPGTQIDILPSPPAYLSGSKGGTIRLELGEASTGSKIVTRPGSRYTDVFIGGTLFVGPLSANPAGFYSGTFQITFVQQ